ncbi:MAG: alpha-E domain-containing protein [Phycisphaerales bacterium]|nr:MAG: alpha-E domain-containing protein [Phycisphaerales bacterium]
MLSRVANSIFWMARYVERAENVARFIDVNLHLMLDLDIESASQWRPLVHTTGDEEAFIERYGEDWSQDAVLRFLVFDTTNPNSIVSCVRAARENARAVRQSISSEMWELANRFHLMMRHAGGGDRLVENPHDFLTEIKMASHLFVGLTETTMSHNEAWNWARMGRLIERAEKTSRIVDVKYYFVLPNVEYVGMPYDNLHWAALLKSATAYEMYRKRYRRIAPEWVAEFLILDRDFPRSVRHCLVKAEESLRAISGSPPGAYLNTAELRLGRLRSDFEFARINDVISGGLHEFLDDAQSRINKVGDAIFDTFIAARPIEPDAVPDVEPDVSDNDNSTHSGASTI